MCQALPIHIFGMGCEADAPLVDPQRVTFAGRLGQPPAAAVGAAALQSVEVFQNAAVNKLVRSVTHLTQTLCKQRAASKKSQGDNKILLMRPRVS